MSNGFYGEARGRAAFSNLLGNASIVTLSPWVLYSDISGSVVSPLLGDLQPGAYLEGGIEAYKSLAE
jgi:hypothetical protein